MTATRVAQRRYNATDKQANVSVDQALQAGNVTNASPTPPRNSQNVKLVMSATTAGIKLLRNLRRLLRDSKATSEVQ